MAQDFLCVLTNKINELTTTINNMQNNTGLYTDPATESTLTGRIKALEESVVTTTPGETNISRMQVDVGLIVQNGKITTTYAPLGDCVNREVMLQDPTDDNIWEPVGNVTFIEDEGNLGTLDYEGWKATVSYLYATKITFEEFDYNNVTNTLVKDLYDYNGTIYKIILTVTPTNNVTLKFVNNLDTSDYYSEVITTEHVRYINEEEFNTSLYITGTAHVKIEIRNRLA